jgi:hypothetical protein
VLFGFSRAGEPLGLAFGIFAATIAAAATAVCAFRRLQAVPASAD